MSSVKTVENIPGVDKVSWHAVGNTVYKTYSMANEKNSSKVVNPKSDDQQHYENTSEMSKPHTSTDHPEEHVDSMAFGEGGKRDPDHDVDGLTDEGSKFLGKETYDLHQANKEK